MQQHPTTHTHTSSLTRTLALAHARKHRNTRAHQPISISHSYTQMQTHILALECTLGQTRTHTKGHRQLRILVLSLTVRTFLLLTSYCVFIKLSISPWYIQFSCHGIHLIMMLRYEIWWNKESNHCHKATKQVLTANLPLHDEIDGQSNPDKRRL